MKGCQIPNPKSITTNYIGRFWAFLLFGLIPLFLQSAQVGTVQNLQTYTDFSKDIEIELYGGAVIVEQNELEIVHISQDLKSSNTEKENLVIVYKTSTQKKNFNTKVLSQKSIPVKEHFNSTKSETNLSLQTRNLLIAFVTQNIQTFCTLPNFILFELKEKILDKEKHLNYCKTIYQKYHFSFTPSRPPPIFL